MSDSIRAALERLQEYDDADPYHDASVILTAARAALAAAPEGEPSDQELYDYWIATSPELGCADPVGFARAVLARWGHQPAPHDDRGVLPMVISDTGASDEPERERIICASISGGADYVNNMPRMLILERIELHKGSICRRYIQEPTPPAEWEVAELAAKLRRLAPHNPLGTADPTITRAAELLQQQHPAPVPVSERLPGPGDCDAEGRCWLLTVEDEYPQWRLHSIEGNQPGGSTMIWVPVDSSPGVMVDAFYASHWLSYPSLPLPDQE